MLPKSRDSEAANQCRSFKSRSKAGVAVSRGTADDGEQAAAFKVLGIQILSAAKRRVQQHESDGDEKGDEDVEPDVSEDEGDNGDEGEDGEDDAVVDDPVEEDEGPVAEEVEEEPGDEDEEEDDEGDGVPEEAEEEDEEDGHGVVDAEVVQVALDAERGRAEREGAREAGDGLDELEPWAARGEVGAGDAPGA
ncbi:hypothetical protein ACLB2K_014046 [Fragaria x ananassa]